MEDLYLYEKKLYKEGFKLIAGVDEVGRGPLIGPVVAAACILPENFVLEGLNDSKKLTEKKRIIYNEYIKKHAISYAIVEISPKEIDEINIYQASRKAMMKAIKKIKPDYVLVDAMPLPDLKIPSNSIIKGDSKSISIAAASVLAKVYRDDLMYKLDKLHPEYGYSSHKGYPTKKHLDAINKFGFIEGYRKSYGPVKKIIEGAE